VGAVLTGPAIVEQLDATTVVSPGQRATVDRAGNLVIRAGRRARCDGVPPRVDASGIVAWTDASLPTR